MSADLHWGLLMRIRFSLMIALYYLSSYRLHTAFVIQDGDAGNVLDHGLLCEGHAIAS